MVLRLRCLLLRLRVTHNYVYGLRVPLNKRCPSRLNSLHRSLRYVATCVRRDGAIVLLFQSTGLFNHAVTITMSFDRSERDEERHAVTITMFLTTTFVIMSPIMSPIITRGWPYLLAR